MSLTAEEVAEFLRTVARGEVALKILGGETWDEAYCGDIQFEGGGWSITIFNDCLELDYVDNATCSDGRTGDFDSWWGAGEYAPNPLNLLNEEESAKLESLIKSLQPQVEGQQGGSR